LGGEYKPGKTIDNLGMLWATQHPEAVGSCSCWGAAVKVLDPCGYVSHCRREHDLLLGFTTINYKKCQAHDAPHKCGCAKPRSSDRFGEAAKWADLGGGCYSVLPNGQKSYFGYTFHSIEMARRWSEHFNPFRWEPRRDILIPPGMKPGETANSGARPSDMSYNGGKGGGRPMVNSGQGPSDRSYNAGKGGARQMINSGEGPNDRSYNGGKGGGWSYGHSDPSRNRAQAQSQPSGKGYR